MTELGSRFPLLAKSAQSAAPGRLVENRKVVCITPGGKRSPFKQYREAWNLMRPTEPEIITVQAIADNAIARAAGLAP